MPQSDHEDVAAEPKSATGQYLRPLLERAHQLEHAKAGETPDLIRGAASKTKTRRKRSSDADSQLEAFEPDTPDHDPGQDLIAAK
jgi:hypothetical protein